MEKKLSIKEYIKLIHELYELGFEHGKELSGGKRTPIEYEDFFNKICNKRTKIEDKIWNTINSQLKINENKKEC